MEELRSRQMGQAAAGKDAPAPLSPRSQRMAEMSAEINGAAHDAGKEAEKVRFRTFGGGIIPAASSAPRPPAQTAGGGSRGTVLSREEAVKIFRGIDRNGSGDITMLELMKALKADASLANSLSLPSRMREGEFFGIFKEIYGSMDSDGSNTISMHKFLAHHTRSEQAPEDPQKQIEQAQAERARLAEQARQQVSVLF